MAKLLVNIDVSDLEAGIRFYTQAFALRVGRRFGRHACELLGAEAPLYVLVKQAGTAPFKQAEQKREYHRHWTPVHLDFEVDDLEAAIARAEKAGAKRESGEIEETAWGRIVQLSDPFGNGFCLLQFTGEGYDTIAT
jgi:predicted enzyme related to lactoylglutathione lyase